MEQMQELKDPFEVEAMVSGTEGISGGAGNRNQWTEPGVVKVVKERLQVNGNESPSVEATYERDDMASVSMEVRSADGVPPKIRPVSSPFLNLIANKVLDGREIRDEACRDNVEDQRSHITGYSTKAVSDTISGSRNPVWSNLFPEKACQQRLRKFSRNESKRTSLTTTEEILAHIVERNSTGADGLNEKVAGSKVPRRHTVNGGVSCERVYRRRQRSLKDLSLQNDQCSIPPEGGVGSLSNALTSVGKRAGETGLSRNSPGVKAGRKKLLPKYSSNDGSHSRSKWSAEDVSAPGPVDNLMESADIVPFPFVQRQSTLDQFWKPPAAAIARGTLVRDIPEQVQPAGPFVKGVSTEVGTSFKSRRKMIVPSRSFLDPPAKGNVFPVIPLAGEAIRDKHQEVPRDRRGSKSSLGMSSEMSGKKVAATYKVEEDDHIPASTTQPRKRSRKPAAPQFVSLAEPLKDVQTVKRAKYSGETPDRKLTIELNDKKPVPRIRKDGKPDARFKHVQNVCLAAQAQMSLPCGELPAVEEDERVRPGESAQKVPERYYAGRFRKDGKPDERFKSKHALGGSGLGAVTAPQHSCLYSSDQGQKDVRGREAFIPEGKKHVISNETSCKLDFRVMREEKLPTDPESAAVVERATLLQNDQSNKNLPDSERPVKEDGLNQEREPLLSFKRGDRSYKRWITGDISGGPVLEANDEINSLHRAKRIRKYKPLLDTAGEKHESSMHIAAMSTEGKGSQERAEAGDPSTGVGSGRPSMDKCRRMKPVTEVPGKLIGGSKFVVRGGKNRKDQPPVEREKGVHKPDVGPPAAVGPVKKLPEVQKNGVRKPKRVQLKRLFVDNPEPPACKEKPSRVVKSLWSPPKQMKHIAESARLESPVVAKRAKSTKFVSLQELDAQDKHRKSDAAQEPRVKEDPDDFYSSDETISDCPAVATREIRECNPAVMDDRCEPLSRREVESKSPEPSTAVSSKVEQNIELSTSTQPVDNTAAEKNGDIHTEANTGVRMTPRARKLTDAMQNFLQQKKTLLQQWKEMEVGKIHPSALIGRSCKIFWPLDSEWYNGVIHEYNPQTRKHRIDYEDEEREWVLLGKERVKLYVSAEESKVLEISFGEGSHLGEAKKPNADELAVLAAGMEDGGGDFSHGDLVWAKVKGYPMWPAFVMDEEHAVISGLEPVSRERTVAVQFFGSYDYARINFSKVTQFSKGIVQKFHTKCKRTVFEQGLQEVERYLKECKLPESMMQLQEDVSSIAREKKEIATCPEESEEDADIEKDEKVSLIEKRADISTMPLKLGTLEILSLGRIVKDSEQFHNEHHIWTDGYTAIRKFTSIKDPQKVVDYKMEIERNPTMPSLPLFRVSPEDGKPVEGSSASACWKRILIKIQRVKEKAGLCEATLLEKKRQSFRSGPSLFGFGHRRVARLIQALPYARVCSKFTAWIEKPLNEDSGEELLPAGYRPVEFRKHLDRCNVCYLDEEYTENQLLQCDKCRMMVHMYCYGEPEAPDGDLWLCNMCRPGAPRTPPLCCLCPVTGGAMKKTTDGRWAHIMCAMWTPETCLVDAKRMEPVDGISSINKERWKLICTVCKVPYGACIQCSKPHCRVSFHPLCARSSGLSMEVTEDKSGNAADTDAGLQMLTFCKKHKPAAQGRRAKTKSQQNIAVASIAPSDTPSRNPSGCARTEPYNSALRRGHREPEALAAALRKRSFVQNQPYSVTGCMRNPPEHDLKGTGASLWSRYWKQVRMRNALSPDAPLNEPDTDNGRAVLSTSERFRHMKSTLHQRLTFGKSAIHGWGVFTKRPHFAGDMVIEYAGEIVRPIIADIRERRSYDSLVGAGTYMFRIDEQRVVDATHAGSLAHLINHSCEPNCYSRVVAASGEDHIIIFAKRDIPEGEELTYDYRFSSKDELLTCYCGCDGCRGSVNSLGTEDEPMKIIAPRSELTKWVQTAPPELIQTGLPLQESSQ
ncbi:hypothetical protein R1sor_001209 [Riccia sorocarpa]|uniref:Histone-lysine N-methyltransferase n=1 Tax=Riccia sorocarpa TaxID=122646 RepID=A0ABD3GXQ9_9MARC